MAVVSGLLAATKDSTFHFNMLRRQLRLGGVAARHAPPREAAAQQFELILPEVRLVVGDEELAAALPVAVLRRRQEHARARDMRERVCVHWT